MKTLTIRPGPGVSIRHYERGPRVSLCTITRLYGHTKVRIRLTDESISDIQEDIIWWSLSESMKRRERNQDWAETLERVDT